MTRARRLGLLFVLVSSALSILWGWSIGWTAYRGPVDFQAVYYGARTLIEHHNPYSVIELHKVFSVEGGDIQASKAIQREKQNDLIELFVNTPGALLCVTPLGLLPIKFAQVIWMVLTAGVLTVAGLLIWRAASGHAPVLSAAAIGFLLLNCQVVIGAGNTAAIVVGFCVIATWCFVRDRFVAAGVVIMALSLAIKPHDSGLVFLYFLLAGKPYRKLAIQSAVLTSLIYVSAFVWLSIVAPTWLHDWQTNLAAISAPGGMNDPRPTSIATTVGAATVISLQGVFSIFSNSSSFYDKASYAVCGLIMLPWAIATARRRGLQEQGWSALAVIVPLTMLVTYHRVYDAKLLLLCIPAFAILWARRGWIGWSALILTSAGVVFSADIPLAALGIFLKRLPISADTISGKIFTAVFERPSQEALLAMSLFFLWVYLKKDIPLTAADTSDELTLSPENPQGPNHARV